MAREQIESPGGLEPFDPIAEYEAFEDLIEAGEATEGALQSVFTAYERGADLQQSITSQVGQDVAVVGATLQGNFYAKRRPGPLNIVNTNWQPRFNLSWDPGRDGRTRLFASAGRFSGAIVLLAPLREVEIPEFTFQLEREGKAATSSSMNPRVCIPPFAANRIQRSLRRKKEGEGL